MDGGAVFPDGNTQEGSQRQVEGLPWWSSASDSMPPMQRAWV